MRLRWRVAGVAVAIAAATLVQAQEGGLQTLEMGTGPTLVLVPGMGASRTDWLPTVKRLRDRYHCVMVEIPGQGNSPLPEPFSLQAAAAALDAVVAKGKPDSTVLVGTDIGGVLSLYAASAHPEHLRGVLLFETPVKSTFTIPDQMRDRMLRYIDENYEQFLRAAFSKLGRDSTENAVLFAKLSAVPPATVRAYIRGMLSLDASRELKTLSVPLAVAFTDSTWKPGQSWGACAREMGYEDSTRVVPQRIRNAGPLMMKDQPDSVAAMISRFAVQAFAAKR